MTAVLVDRSFRANLVGLLVAALLSLLVFAGPQVKVQHGVETHSLQATEMAAVDGEGWGKTILWIGVGIVVVGTICVLAAPVAIGIAAAMADAGATAASVSVAATGTTLFNVGGYGVTVGGGAAALGGALDTAGH